MLLHTKLFVGDTTMRFSCSFAIAVLVIAVACNGPVHASGATDTRRSVHTAIRNAHTANDYAELAHYFGERSIELQKRAQDQKRVLCQELNHPSTSSKYPSAAERARRFREYYTEQSRRFLEQSAHYAHLAQREASVISAR
jgi:hypothetical protein